MLMPGHTPPQLSVLGEAEAQGGGIRSMSPVWSRWGDDFPVEGRDAGTPFRGRASGFADRLDREDGPPGAGALALSRDPGPSRRTTRTVSEGRARSRVNPNRTIIHVKFFNTVQENWIRRWAATLRAAPPSRQWQQPEP